MNKHKFLLPIVLGSLVALSACPGSSTPPPSSSGGGSGVAPLTTLTNPSSGLGATITVKGTTCPVADLVIEASAVDYETSARHGVRIKVKVFCKVTSTPAPTENDPSPAPVTTLVPQKGVTILVTLTNGGTPVPTYSDRPMPNPTDAAGETSNGFPVPSALLSTVGYTVTLDVTDGGTPPATHPAGSLTVQ